MEHEKSGVVAERFKQERERLGYSQAAFADLGAAKLRTLQNWEGGKNFPSSEFLADTAKYGVDINFILTGHRDSQEVQSKRNLSGSAPLPADCDDVVLVPLMSATGSMGSGNELVTEDVVLGDIPLSRRWLSMNIPGVRTDALRLIHAYGDSMHGTLNSGDFAVVDTSCRTVEFPGVYLLHVNRLHFIKRVSFRMDGRLVVSSDNEAERTAEVLDGSHQLDVRGRVVYGWNGRRF